MSDADDIARKREEVHGLAHEQLQRRRPEALATYQEITARQARGEKRRGDASKLKTAREVLKITGGVPT